MIATQLKSIDEIKAELEALKAKKDAKKATRQGKRDWYGLVYCDSYGWCWIADFENGEVKDICLGRTEEFIPYLRERRIDGENVTGVLMASQEFSAEKKSEKSPPAESKTQSCHLDTKNCKGYIIDQGEKLNRATFSKNTPKNDEKLSAILETLIKKDYGIPTIQRELVNQGYRIPYRTLGRWVAQARSIPFV